MEIDPTLDDIELLARRMVRAHRKAKPELHLRDNGRSFFTGSLRIKTTGYLCRDRPRSRFKIARRADQHRQGIPDGTGVTVNDGFSVNDWRSWMAAQGPSETLDLAQSSRSRAQIGAKAAHTRGSNFGKSELAKVQRRAARRSDGVSGAAKEGPDFQPPRLIGVPQ